MPRQGWGAQDGDAASSGVSGRRAEARRRVAAASKGRQLAMLESLLRFRRERQRAYQAFRAGLRDTLFPPARPPPQPPSLGWLLLPRPTSPARPAAALRYPPRTPAQLHPPRPLKPKAELRPPPPPFLLPSHLPSDGCCWPKDTALSRLFGRICHERLPNSPLPRLP